MFGINFHLDPLSFLIGVLTGTLVWFVLSSYREMWPRIKQTVRDRSAELRQLNAAGIEDRLRAEILRHAQARHVGARLFPLDEIIIEPRLLAPPPQISPDNPPAPDNIVSQVVAYIPEWPEFGSHFGVPTLALEAPLKENLNMAIIGQPGMGKSVALAYLATKAVRQEFSTSNLNEYFPLLLDYSDLPQPVTNQNDPAKPIIDVIVNLAPTLIKAQIPGFLRTRFNSGKIILFLDGLDELSTKALREACVYLERLLAKYHGIKLVTTASPDYWDGLQNLGVRLFSLASWTRPQIAHYIQGWIGQWVKDIIPIMQHPERAGTLDPLMAQIWLMADHKYLTPLEWTLLTWAVCVGDIRGPNVIDTIEATLRRVTGQKSLRPLEILAMEMVLTGRLAFPKIRAGQFLEMEPMAPSSGSNPPTNPKKTTGTETEHATIRPQQNSMTLSSLLENGILIEQGPDAIAFFHPVITGYLAGKALVNNPNGLTEINGHAMWIGKSLAIRYLSSQKDITPFLQGYIGTAEEPLYRNLLLAARWVKDTPFQTSWRSEIIDKLTELLQREMLPIAISERALAALIYSEDVSLPGFFRQMLHSNSPRLAQLAALGCGALGNQHSVADLTSILQHPSETVRGAACLALVSLRSQPAIEAVAKALIQADENTRRSAAESLANDPMQGHPVLKDGSTVADLLIRRAVVYGLARVPEEWALDVLDKMRVEDSQWIVRNAAAQVIETRQQPDPYIPRQTVNPSMAPWLVAFAARNGMGIPAGTPATEMLLLALEKGELDEQIAAIGYLKQMQDRDVIQTILRTIKDGVGIPKEAAANALYEMSSSGVTLLSANAPTQDPESLDHLRQAF